MKFLIFYLYLTGSSEHSKWFWACPVIKNQSAVTTEHDQNQSAVKFLTTEHGQNHLLCS